MTNRPGVSTMVGTKISEGEVFVYDDGSNRYQTAIETDDHRLTGDEPEAMGGRNKGPDPFEYLLASLGLCTVITVRMYADRKKWPVDTIRAKCALSKQDEGTGITLSLAVTGDLDDDQGARLLEIAKKCPVHKTLTGEIDVDHQLAAEEAS